jgi:hypothetical protein
MQHYESRIIGPTGAIGLISHCSYLDDATAISAAKNLCRDGDRAEVWRDDVCVHRPIEDQPSARKRDDQAA